ncbi:MAG: PqqD family protein [Acidimicrobiia bacterium]|nr:PqqD family protein [Acidimicrobiia bacterium]
MARRLVQAPSVLVRRGLRDLYVLPPGQAAPTVVTPPGVIVWDLLADPISVDSLVAELAELFDADEGEIRSDIEPVLDELVAVGVLVDAGSDG